LIIYHTCLDDFGESIAFPEIPVCQSPADTFGPSHQIKG
jgi:hypothetical protein